MSKSSRYVNHSEKNEKILKFEKFIDELIIFDDTQKEQSSENFTCALGPRLLLHGKIYPMRNGYSMYNIVFISNQFSTRKTYFLEKRSYLFQNKILSKLIV